MPPGDTIILNSFNELPDSIRQVIDNLISLQPYQQPDEQRSPTYPFPEWLVILFVFGIVILSAYLYVIRPASGKRRKTRKIFSGVPVRQAVIDIQYDQWLCKYNPYYNSLSVPLKKRFLHRTRQFMQSKEFRFHFMEAEEQVMVLVSGAAVQLTFGLKNFLIRFFPVINVIKREYSYAARDKIVEGHVQVSNQTINISWNNFIADYEDYTDSENLGLHEMAHAISFDFLYGHHENRNAAFTERFKEYILEAGPVFKQLCEGRNDLLDDYGTLNVEEFWAVSIESFFENSLEFRDKMPRLYAAIAEVLNQDPLRNEKIIDKRLAGLAI